MCVLVADPIIVRSNGRRRSSARFCEIIDDFLAEREGAANRILAILPDTSLLLPIVRLLPGRVLENGEQC